MEENIILTMEELDNAVPGSILRQGTAFNSPDDLDMTYSNKGRKLLWVAKRGGINDWVIYIHWEDQGLEYVLRAGDKITTPANIKRLVPCTGEAFNRYRY